MQRIPPIIADAATAQERDANQLMQHAARLPPSALVIDFGDLVARALAILAEETEAWHARRVSNLPRGSAP
jgi:hypothetical protein